MAKPKTYSWSKFIILLGDGAQTEVFTAVCALVSKGVEFSSDTADVNVPDCTNPDLPSWTERVVRGKSASITGEGVMDFATHTQFYTWFDAGTAKSVQIKLDAPLADKGGIYQGKFVLSAYQVTGNEDDAKISHSLTMQSDGPVTWTLASSLMADEEQLADAA
jgi:predicted secreted protein